MELIKSCGAGKSLHCADNAQMTNPCGRVQRQHNFCPSIRRGGQITHYRDCSRGIILPNDVVQGREEGIALHVKGKFIPCRHFQRRSPKRIRDLAEIIGVRHGGVIPIAFVRRIKIDSLPYPEGHLPAVGYSLVLLKALKKYIHRHLRVQGIFGPIRIAQSMDNGMQIMHSLRQIQFTNGPARRFTRLQVCRFQHKNGLNHTINRPFHLNGIDDRHA